MKKILFVCAGNTCRSPMAESILRHKLKQKKVYKNFKVDSAGLALRKGDGVVENTTLALKDLKILPVRHKARLLTKAMLKNYDLIFTMTDEYKEYLQNYSNVYSLAEYTNGIDILDPYGQDIDTYKKTAQLLMFTIDEVVSKIIK